MNLLELFQKYEKAADVVLVHYRDVFLKSIEDSDASEEFKEFARQQHVDEEAIAEIIAGNPRGTFDVFDANEVYIQISVDIENKCFRYSFDGGKVESNDYTNRKEAEAAAVEKAFEILNEKL